jgi:deoxyhypusine synthase
VQIITDAAHWGGLSGCPFKESQSWGKIAHDASMVDVHCDSTIALPKDARPEQPPLRLKDHPPTSDFANQRAGARVTF